MCLSTAGVLYPGLIHIHQTATDTRATAPMRVLITGGSGYLGQFLLSSLSNNTTKHELAYTHLTTQPLPNNSVQAFQVNLATGEGLTEALSAFKPQVVINCAALSQPAACETDYEACRALNCPTQLVAGLKQLEQQHGIRALVIHLSTDQVGWPWLVVSLCVRIGAQQVPSLQQSSL